MKVRKIRTAQCGDITLQYVEAEFDISDVLFDRLADENWRYMRVSDGAMDIARALTQLNERLKTVEGYVLPNLAETSADSNMSL